MSTGERVFKGLTPEQRRGERRARLLAAALEVIGTRGWRDATMTEVCRTAKLTERYFYESFRSREELYVALIEALADEVRSAVLAAAAKSPPDDPRARVRAGAVAVVGVLVGDSRKGRAALLEGIGSPELERRRREIIGGFADMLVEQRATFFGDAPIAPGRDVLAATAIAGALTALVARRLDGTLAVGDDELIDFVTEMALQLELG